MEVAPTVAEAVWSGSGGEELVRLATEAGAPRLVVSTEVGGGERVWGPRVVGEFDRAVDALARGVEGAGARVLLRPSSRGVLSDIPSVLRFARRAEGTRLGVLLEPSALLAESMMAHAEDHVVRMGEMLGPLGCVEGVFLSGVEPGLRRCSAMEGAPGPGVLREVVAHVRAGVPVVVMGERGLVRELGLE